MIDYTTESQRLAAFVPGEQSKFWKPKPGQYRVKALSELEDAPPFQKEGEADKPQVQLRMIVDDNPVTWTMARGASPASSYGQLVNLAMNKGGKLKDIEFMIVVTNDKKKNSYTIVLL